jgi:hypothetical protein
MSSGQYRHHYGFNKSIIKDGMIVRLEKNGKVKSITDPKTGKVVSQ